MDTLVSFGSEIKALGETSDGAMKFGAWLVLFGDPDNTDATKLRDYFTKSTDFDFEDGDKTTVYYNHGLDPELKRRKLGTATLHMKDAGVWMEGQLKARDEYEAKIQEMIKAGKLGASSGVPSHLVERKNVGNAHEIVLWPLGKDASLTPTPAEYRTSAHALKSLDQLIEDEGEEAEIKRASPKKAPPAGHWITHNGAHVFIPDHPVDSDHVYAAGVVHGLDVPAHQVLEKAHNDGEIQTASHLHLTLAHAKRRIAEGADEVTAVKEGLAKHGFNGTTSHAEKYRDAVEAHQHMELAHANKDVIESRRNRVEAFRASGQDIVDYVSNYAQSHDDAQAIAKDLGYHSPTWDDQRNNRRREKEKARSANQGMQRARLVAAGKSIDDGHYAVIEWGDMITPNFDAVKTDAPTTYGSQAVAEILDTALSGEPTTETKSTHNFTSPDEVVNAVTDILRGRMPAEWHSGAVRATVKSFGERVIGITDMRADEYKAGRVLSQANYDRLCSHRDALREILGEIEGLLETHAPNAANDDEAAKAIMEEVDAIELAWLQSESRRLGVAV